jgi:hypothetical protein
MGGGYVWACKNYDGDVQSDTVAQLRFARPDDGDARATSDGGGRGRGRARHRDRHFRQHQQGAAHLHEPDRVDLRLDARPGRCGRMDSTPEG